MRFTVSELNRAVHTLLERHFQQVEVVGEVAQLQIPSSGHAYLTLRHGQDTLSAVVWRTNWMSQRFRPKVGDQVICRGTLGVYGARGATQLYATLVLPLGSGLLAAELEARKSRLAADGLLDERRKRPLPAHPRFVGVATSLTGAALQDFLKVSRDRFPATRLLIAGCVVQGPEAPASIRGALELLWLDGRSEVIVVTRGGGSKEDLMAFQDEGLARAIASSPVPVVSAVGHQVDTTIADLVADAVAPTPSAAAMCVLPDGARLTQRVDDAELALRAAWARTLRDRRARVAHAKARLRHPGERLVAVRHRSQSLVERLRSHLTQRIRAARARQAAADASLAIAGARITAQGRARVKSADLALRPGLARIAARDRARLVDLERRLDAAIAQRLHVATSGAARWSQRLRPPTAIAAGHARLAAANAALRALSPFAVLDRGYAIVSHAGHAVQRASAVRPGDRVHVRLARGAVHATIDTVLPDSDGSDR